MPAETIEVVEFLVRDRQTGRVLFREATEEAAIGKLRAQVRDFMQSDFEVYRHSYKMVL